MRAFLALLLALAAAPLAAAQSASATPGAGGGEGLSAARREFETVKAFDDGIAPAPPSISFPRISQPALEPSVVVTPATAPPEKKAGKDKTSATWLIDATTARAPGTGSQRGRDFEKTTRSLLPLELDAFDVAAGEASAFFVTAPTDDNNRPRDPRAHVEAVNPLNPYLAGWMTPQDYALLRPRPVSDAGTAPATPAKPPANPYLEPTAAPSIFEEATPEDPVPLAAPPPTPGLTAPAVPPPIAPQRTIPDFVRPLSDEKYFRQLKRF